MIFDVFPLYGLFTVLALSILLLRGFSPPTPIVENFPDVVLPASAVAVARRPTGNPYMVGALCATRFFGFAP